jgi:poly(3-hydroxybutyrate) depolymerase
VSVLEIHGTLDTVIFFGGGRLPHSNFKLIEYPDADETAAIWASKNGCQPEPESLSQRLDLDAVVPGAETSLRRYRGCRPHGEVEQWTMHGSGHVPLFRPAFVDEVYRFLLAHPKP